MKRIIAIAVLIVGAAFGSTSRASAQQPKVVANVPFDFVLENRTLPAGTYRIESHGEFLSIESQDGSKTIFATASQGETRADGKAELDFDVVDGKRYLRRVVSSTADTSKDFPACKMEKEAGVLLASHKTTEVINAVARGR
jgi:hypothetical protein